MHAINKKISMNVYSPKDKRNMYFYKITDSKMVHFSLNGEEPKNPLRNIRKKLNIISKIK